MGGLALSVSGQGDVKTTEAISAASMTVDI
jgi:hypothetical protein